MGGAVLAAVTGAMVVQSILGPQPAFRLPSVTAVDWRMYLVLPFVAAFASLLGVAFQAATVSLRGRVRERSRLPAWLRPACGALATWAIGCAVFLATGHHGVFGLGYGDLSLALADGLPWTLAGILVAAKLGATVFSYAWGGCGGIFAPTLFLGGLSGLFVSGAAGLWLPLSSSDRIVLAAVGMSACFGAVVRAPLTALLIVFEMTHQFAMVPALMFCTVVSQAVARLGGRHNFYDAILLQDGHEILKIRPPRDLESWQGLPVGQIAVTRAAAVTSLDPQALRLLLEEHPYARFPVACCPEDRVALRGEILRALAERRPPGFQPAASCGPDMPVREAARLLVESETGMILVRDPGTGELRGVLTLHDLLRAQAAACE